MRRAGTAALLAAGALAVPPAARAVLGPSYGGVLRVAASSLPRDLAPSAAKGRVDALAQGLVHETLLAVAADGTLRPSLASECVAAEGGREWRIALPPGAFFHDGAPLTSADALRSLERFVAAGTPAGRMLGAALAGIAAPDPGHLVLRLTRPHEAALAALASPAAAITSPRGAGAGPFVPTATLPGRTALTAFPGHVRGRPLLDGVEIASSADPAADVGAGRADLGLGAGGAAGNPAEMLLAVVGVDHPGLATPPDRAALAAVLGGAALAAALPGGAPPAGLLLHGPPEPSPVPRPSPPPRLRVRELAVVVSSDVPPLASQRVLALLSAAGVKATIAARDPESARTARAPLRLLAWTPEVAEPALALAELAALVGGDARVSELRGDARVVALAALPLPAVTARGLRGVAVSRNGRLVVEDAWLER